MSDPNVSGPVEYGAIDLGAASAPGAPTRAAAAGPAQVEPGYPADYPAAPPAHPDYPGVPAAYPGAPAAPAATIPAPLVEAVTEQNFEQQMALSQTVPVILAVYSAKSLTSQQARTVLSDAVREYQGAFALRELDVDTQPQLAAALQVQALPTAMALVGGRPVPLFEGVPVKSQLTSVLDELLQVAPSMGVTGRLEVTSDELVSPIPPAHEAPLAAQDAGEWEKAIGLWRKVLANNPADTEAKLALARAEFELRQETASVDADDAQAAADQLFAVGQEAQAFDLLLAQVTEGTADEREAARARLVELFALATDPAAVKSARTRLATVLLV